MIIGSDLHFTYLLKRYVRESAHPLLFSGLDEKAFDMAAKERPALIILEDCVADSTSREMIRTLKMNLDTKNIPVVLCSWQEVAACSAGTEADVYLRMPILYADFLAILSQMGIK
jgi:response regulator RpfG family c-di-GMP phosphodiesterase